MRAKLRFRAEEMKGFVTLVYNLCGKVTDATFMGMMFGEAMRGLLQRLMAKRPWCKKSYAITLTEMETLAIEYMLEDLLEEMMPYERAIGCVIQASMAEQMEERSRMMNEAKELQLKLK